jgi:hypothetical protein
MFVGRCREMWVERDSVMGRPDWSCDGPRLAGERVEVADARDAFSRQAGAISGDAMTVHL